MSAMDEREELIGQMYDVIRGALIVNEQRSFMEQVQEAARGVVDALLADGRWLLVHPDEMIRRDQLEQVGWINGAGSIVALDAALNGWEPVHRVRPAVEKETCGRLMVGSGTDTYDPVCELPAGHTGDCRSSAAIDQHRLTSPAVEKENDQ